MQFVTSRLAKNGKENTCFHTFVRIYYDWGLNHVILLAVLAAYSFLGAGIFVLFEAPAQELRQVAIEAVKSEQRELFIREIFVNVFNDSDRFLIFVSREQSAQIQAILNKELISFEQNISIATGAVHEKRMRWDFWNSMLYCWTIITTIGYGHLYPTTDGGKIATMVYAIFGIPLMLVILNDLGKLLTKFMKFPWFLAKKWGRRLFQYCTRMSREEIRAAEKRDRETLEVFDLPVVVAIGIVVGWIFFCSAIQMLWESDWDYLVAFYFFFISLSTIGLGDIAPKEPRYLLIMFWNIAIGLSLVSMCISLIQTKLEKTYHVGQDETAKEIETEDIDDAMVSDAIRRVHSVPIAIAMDGISTSESRRNSQVSSQSAPASVLRRPKRNRKPDMKDKRLSTTSPNKTETSGSSPETGASNTETKATIEPTREKTKKGSKSAKQQKKAGSSTWSLDPQLFESNSDPERKPVRGSKSYSRGFPKDVGGSADEQHTKPKFDIIPIRKAPPTPPLIKIQASQLKKELSQYDNMDLMGPGDILDQVQHEERLGSLRKSSFPQDTELHWKDKGNNAQRQSRV